MKRLIAYNIWETNPQKIQLEEDREKLRKKKQKRQEEFQFCNNVIDSQIKNILRKNNKPKDTLLYLASNILWKEMEEKDNTSIEKQMSANMSRQLAEVCTNTYNDIARHLVYSINQPMEYADGEKYAIKLFQDVIIHNEQLIYNIFIDLLTGVESTLASNDTIYKQYRVAIMENFCHDSIEQYINAIKQYVKEDSPDYYKIINNKIIRSVKLYCKHFMKDRWQKIYKQIQKRIEDEANEIERENREEIDTKSLQGNMNEPIIQEMRRAKNVNDLTSTITDEFVANTDLEEIANSFNIHNILSFDEIKKLNNCKTEAEVIKILKDKPSRLKQVLVKAIMEYFDPYETWIGYYFEKKSKDLKTNAEHIAFLVAQEIINDVDGSWLGTDAGFLTYVARKFLR